MGTSIKLTNWILLLFVPCDSNKHQNFPEFCLYNIFLLSWATPLISQLQMSLICHSHPAPYLSFQSLCQHFVLTLPTCPQTNAKSLNLLWFPPNWFFLQNLFSDVKFSVFFPQCGLQKKRINQKKLREAAACHRLQGWALLGFRKGWMLILDLKQVCHKDRSNLNRIKLQYSYSKILGKKVETYIHIQMSSLKIRQEQEEKNYRSKIYHNGKKVISINQSININSLKSSNKRKLVQSFLLSSLRNSHLQCIQK